MYAFSYWYAYYDSLFLRSLPRPSRYLLEQLQIASAVHMNWAAVSDLPQLARLFDAFEKFLLDSNSWNCCFCDEQQLQRIEGKLNDLVILLYCEKIYGKQYWEQDKRRVQASFIHFCIIFKQFLMAILPEDAATIQQASSEGSLPTSLEKLETIVNAFLEQLQPIHKYLFLPYFLEESQLTLELFVNLGSFLQNLPKIRRQKFAEIPRLMRFICLSNTLEANRSNSIKQFNITRKKSETFQLKIKSSSPMQRKDAEDDRKSDILVNREFIKTTSISSRHDSKESKDRSSAKYEKYTFFKFKKKLSKLDSKIEKKYTMTTLNTKEKSSTIDRLSRYRSTTLEQSFHGPSKSRTFEKRLPSKTKHRKNSAQSIQSKVLKFIDGRDCEEQMERINNTRTAKKIVVNVKFTNFSSVVNLATGRSKGWALVREELFKRIAKKRLGRMLNQ